MKIGLIDVGGGMRGAYATGVLEFFHNNNIKFDCCIGVSAGSENLINFISGQPERNFRNYFTYAFRKEYSGISTFLKTGNFLNLKYINETLSNSDGEDLIDYEAFEKNPTEFLVVAEECVSGKTKYFSKKDISKDNYKVLSASCNIPVINRPVEIDGKTYFDGGFADPIPIKKAFEEGCEKVVLILTRLRDIPRKSTRDSIFAKILGLKFPKAAEGLKNRAKNYNESLEYAKKLEDEGKVLILSPKNVYGLDTLTRKIESMKKIYEDGKKDAEKILEWYKK